MGKTYLGARRKRTNTPAENRKRAVEYRHERYAAKPAVFTASVPEPEETLIEEIIPETAEEEILLSEEIPVEEEEEEIEEAEPEKKVSEFRRYSEAKFYAPRHKRTNTPVNNRKRAVEYRHIRYAKKPAETVPEEQEPQTAPEKLKDFASDIKNGFNSVIKKTGAFFSGLFASIKAKTKKKKTETEEPAALPEEEPVKTEELPVEEIPAEEPAEETAETIEAAETEVTEEVPEETEEGTAEENTEEAGEEEPQTAEEEESEEEESEEEPEEEEETSEPEEEEKQYQKPKTLKERAEVSRARHRWHKLDKLDEIVDRPTAGLFKMILFPGTSMERVSTAGYPTISMFSSFLMNLIKWGVFGSFVAVVLRDYVSQFEMSVIQLNFTASAGVAFKVGIFALLAEYFCYYTLFVIAGLIRRPVSTKVLVDVSSRSSLASALVFLAACFAVHHDPALGFAVMIGGLIFEIVMKAYAIILTVDRFSSTAKFWIILILVTLISWVSFKYFALALNNVTQILIHILNLK